MDSLENQSFDRVGFIIPHFPEIHSYLIAQKDGNETSLYTLQGHV